MISYCIAVFRPRYARLLVDDLARKTTTPFEILLWLNTDDREFETHVTQQSERGVPVRVVGRSDANIGMRAYRSLFRAARFPLIAQIDDDVVRVSPGIAQRASRLFARFPNVRQLVADVWQDQHTTGARPPLSAYRSFDVQEGLYDGPVDGWFSIYHRSVIALADTLPYSNYFPLGGMMRARLIGRRMHGLLDTGMKVFHVVGPAYASFYGMLEFEIAKYAALGRGEIVRWYRDAQPCLPASAELETSVAGIYQRIDNG
jgi:hypothetical protein